MRLRRALWLGAGVVAGAYLIGRRRRNLAIEPPPLHDHAGRVLEPRAIELDGGEKVLAIDAGDGPTIVMIPGLSGDRQVYRYQVADFTRSHRVIVPNLRTNFDGVAYSFDQFAHDIAAVMDARGVDSAVVLGLSFGGAIAMRFATLYPQRVRALILTATLARYDISHVGLNRTLFIPLAHWTSRYVPEPLMRQLAEIWGHWGIWVYDPSSGNPRIVEYELAAPAAVPAGVGALRMHTFRDLDLRPDLPGIDRPALVIAGSADGYTPDDWQREIAGLLPDSTYVEIPDAGHLALISRAETFNRVVRGWLEELPGEDEEIEAPPTGTA